MNSVMVFMALVLSAYGDDFYPKDFIKQLEGDLSKMGYYDICDLDIDAYCEPIEDDSIERWLLKQEKIQSFIPILTSYQDYFTKNPYPTPKYDECVQHCKDSSARQMKEIKDEFDNIRDGEHLKYRMGELKKVLPECIYAFCSQWDKLGKWGEIVKYRLKRTRAHLNEINAYISKLIKREAAQTSSERVI